MAVLENLCTNNSCPFHGFSNSAVSVCPLCGDKAVNFPTDDFESPRGDDYDDMVDFED